MNSSANSAAVMSTPQTDSRSVTAIRWGEVYRPVVSPFAQAIAVATRAAVPLPFVPVTWIVGYAGCGSSR